MLNKMLAGPPVVLKKNKDLLSHPSQPDMAHPLLNHKNFIVLVCRISRNVSKKGAAHQRLQDLRLTHGDQLPRRHITVTFVGEWGWGVEGSRLEA